MPGTEGERQKQSHARRRDHPARWYLALLLPRRNGFLCPLRGSLRSGDASSPPLRGEGMLVVLAILGGLSSALNAALQAKLLQTCASQSNCDGSYMEERKARALCMGVHPPLGNCISGTRALPYLNYATVVFVLTIKGQTSPVAF